VALTEHQLAAAREAWPGVEVAGATVEAYVAARGGTEISDLYLACACVERDARALSHFDRELASCVDRAVRRLGGDRSVVDEVKQRLRDRVLVGTPERPARITEYSGRGPLRGWLRVIASREVLDMRRREKHEVALGDQTIDGLESPDHDPALQYLKVSYRAAFRHAFGGAFSALEPHERDLIRHHHLDGENVAQLAARHGVHRATAARWVARARDRLLIGTRERLAASLGVDDQELDSILRLVSSRLEVSLRSLS
jgi:RNA polymerase sigma-70 factor (ECF subfamily)